MEIRRHRLKHAQAGLLQVFPEQAAQQRLGRLGQQFFGLERGAQLHRAIPGIQVLGLGMAGQRRTGLTHVGGAAV
ncbi:hypothetical protein D3C72_1439650 [compost metagenome]